MSDSKPPRDPNVPPPPSADPPAPSVPTGPRRSPSLRELVAQTARPRTESSDRMRAVRVGPRSAPPTRDSTRPPASMTPLSRRTAPLRTPVDFALITPATRVLEEMLCVAAGERVLIAHDEANAEIARAFESAAEECGGRPERLDLDREPDAPRPWTACPAAALAALQGASASVLAIRNDDAEYDARYQLVTAAMAARGRHVQMVGVSRRAFVASVSASVSRVVELLQQVRESMRPSSRVTVRSRAGTQLEVDLAPSSRWFTNGNVLRAGQWMTVPYGSLVTSPASVSGVYVADASVGGELGARLGSLAARSVRLVFEAGRVRSVECRDPMLKSYVERFAADGQGRERVGLVVLGANVGISAPIGELQHDENAPGLHLSLGETFPARTGATWTAHGQLAFAMADADVDIDGEAVIRQGRYVRFV